MYARKDGARDSLSFRGNLDCRRQDTDHLKLIDFGLSALGLHRTGFKGDEKPNNR